MWVANRLRVAKHMTMTDPAIAYQRIGEGLVGRQRLDQRAAAASPAYNPGLPYRYVDGHPSRSRNPVAAHDVSDVSFVSCTAEFVILDQDVVDGVGAAGTPTLGSPNITEVA